MTQQHFNKEYGNNASENYERFFVPAIGAPVASDLINHAMLREDERVLDVACGTGIVSRMAAEEVGATGSVAGLDINPGMLSVARTVSPSGIEWHQSSAEELPFADNTFDVALCQLSLQFVPEKLKALNEMNRVLVPGGRAILNTPGPPSPVYDALIEALQECISAEAAGFVKKVFSLHNVNEMQQLMTDAGFNEVSVTRDEKTFKLPVPKDFLWQYIKSTPLAAMTAQADEDTLTRFEDKVLSTWSEFEEDGNLIDHLNIMVASACK